MWKHFYLLFKKDCQMMIAGKFFLLAFGSLLVYTLFINLGYVRFMKAELYPVYLYDPLGTQPQASDLIRRVPSLEELDKALAADTNSVGINAALGTPDILLFYGSEKVDRHRADYARALLYPDGSYTAETVGTHTPELKLRKEITCELLFIEIVAVGFLGIASVLFKEKQMGVIRIHAVLPIKKSIFILSKITVFLLSDFIFAALLTICNVGFGEAVRILPAVLVQTGILSLLMALTGFGCAMLLADFKQFSLAYLVIAMFAAAPVFISANTAVKVAWIDWHPFYQIYMGLKNAYFGTPVTTLRYYACAACAIAVLFFFVQAVFRKEMGKEG